MATLTVRNIDEGLKASLRGAAARHGRSMEEEVRQILRDRLSGQAPEAGVGAKPPHRFAALDEVERGASDLDPQRPDTEVRRRREEAAKWYEGYRRQVLANQNHEASLLSDDDVNALVHELR